MQLLGFRSERAVGGGSCDRCGCSAGDVRLVVLEGGGDDAERMLCGLCAETVREVLVETLVSAESLAT
jgi:hypothetical protein